MNFRKTKIVAKIADNKSEIDFLKTLKNAGADVWWINTAHQEEAESLEVIKRMREVSTDMPILLDTKGPEVRTKNVENPINVKTGDFITFTGDLSVTGENIVNVTYPNFANEVPVGEVVLYDDASVGLEVVEKTDKGIKCIVKNDGVIKNKKSLNIPNVHIELPALTEKDQRFVHFCAKNGVDYVIHSFVRNKADIFEIKDILKNYPEYKGKIIAKIENREGFENLEEILDNCEGLMVARGDLGAEVPLEEMFYMQKKMVEMSLKKGKICIVATQVLDSMIKNPRPTRAEVTDAGNAVLDGTCAISMSGETAYGDYPVEATEMMARIMKYTEEKIGELVHFKELPTVDSVEYKKAKEIVEKANSENSKIIVVLGGNTEITRAISAFRPKSIVVPVIDEWSVREFGLAYGVRGVTNIDELKKDGGIKSEDNILVVDGESLGYSVKKFSDL